jgi:hypothetical protein
MGDERSGERRTRHGVDKGEHVGRYRGNNKFRRGQRADVSHCFVDFCNTRWDQASMEHCAAPPQDTCLPSPKACPSDIGAADAVT